MQAGAARLLAKWAVAAGISTFTGVASTSTTLAEFASTSASVVQEDWADHSAANGTGPYAALADSNLLLWGGGGSLPPHALYRIAQGGTLAAQDATGFSRPAGAHVGLVGLPAQTIAYIAEEPNLEGCPGKISSIDGATGQVRAILTLQNYQIVPSSLSINPANNQLAFFAWRCGSGQSTNYLLTYDPRSDQLIETNISMRSGSDGTGGSSPDLIATTAWSSDGAVFYVLVTSSETDMGLYGFSPSFQQLFFNPAAVSIADAYVAPFYLQVGMKGTPFSSSLFACGLTPQGLESVFEMHSPGAGSTWQAIAGGAYNNPSCALTELPGGQLLADDGKGKVVELAWPGGLTHPPAPQTAAHREVASGLGQGAPGSTSGRSAIMGHGAPAPRLGGGTGSGVQTITSSVPQALTGQAAVTVPGHAAQALPTSAGLADAPEADPSIRMAASGFGGGNPLRAVVQIWLGAAMALAAAAMAIWRPGHRPIGLERT
jgi:hypothetical protein